MPKGGKTRKVAVVFISVKGMDPNFIIISYESKVFGMLYGFCCLDILVVKRWCNFDHKGGPLVGSK